MERSRNTAARRRRAWKTCSRGRPVPETGEGKPSGAAESPASNGGAFAVLGNDARVEFIEEKGGAGVRLRKRGIDSEPILAAA
jgi:hypothetical protein